MAFGRCNLTLKQGTFVDSHIIPQALTRPDPGKNFIEGGLGRRLTSRPSSWYDPKLVTRKGEDILSELDSFAIKTLRDNLIVWSGWGTASKLPVETQELHDGYGIRRIEKIDTLKLRLFFLSIFWRAAVTQRSEFSNVTLGSSQREVLRNCIVNGDSGPSDFLPVYLIQHSTLGPRHNLGPLKGSDLQDTPEAEAPSILTKAYRFYFDGLVAYICYDLSAEEFDVSRNLFVGENDYALVGCVPFENSWQQTNLKNHITAAQAEWPDIYNRLVR